MGYYDNILNLLSLALTFAILFIVIYGCQFKKYRYIEKFRRLREGLTRIKKKRKKTKQETGSNFFFLAVAH